MDPITLIVTALVAGATSGLKGVAGDAVKDAYHALKGAIRRRSGTGADVEVALTRVESKPDVWTEPLKDVLAEVGADRDAEIVRAAQTLMSLIDPQQAAAGRYQVQIMGNVQGLAQGDHQHVEMTFRDGTDPA
jgi:hypothetical protein